MQIIHFLGKTCKSYIRSFGIQCPSLQFHCPNCNERHMHKHGHFKRTVSTKHQTFTIPIYRWFCPQCKQTLSLLPDFLIPWARFTTMVREASVMRRTNGFSFNRIAQTVATFSIGISASTIKRWWKWHLQQIPLASSWIASELIQRQVHMDLFRIHFRGIQSTVADSAQWFRKLQQLYIATVGSELAPLRGFWCWFNTKLPLSSIL